MVRYVLTPVTDVCWVLKHFSGTMVIAYAFTVENSFAMIIFF